MHSVEETEMKEVKTELRKLYDEENNFEDVKMQAQLTKTKMCKFYIQGVCQKGPQCPWAHSKSELRSSPDLTRTKLCKEMLEKGICDRPNCTYAHNKEQLRSTDAFHKTKPCHFWQQGYCNWGDKCRFAHDAIVKQEDPESRMQYFNDQSKGGGKGYCVDESRVDSIARKLDDLRMQNFNDHSKGGGKGSSLEEQLLNGLLRKGGGKGSSLDEHLLNGLIEEYRRRLERTTIGEQNGYARSMQPELPVMRQMHPESSSPTMYSSDLHPPEAPPLPKFLQESDGNETWDNGSRPRGNLFLSL